MNKTVIQYCEKHSMYLQIVLDHIMLMHTNGYKIDQTDIINRFSSPPIIIKNISCTLTDKTIIFEEIIDGTILRIVLDWTMTINKNIKNMYTLNRVN